jgi:hypothetical protein
MYMNYITTTDLRTQSSRLVELLLKGSKVTLIHRSKIVGIIEPPPPKTKVFDVKKFKDIMKDVKIHHTEPEEREKIYREHLLEKYGKGIS